MAVVPFGGILRGKTQGHIKNQEDLLEWFYRKVFLKSLPGLVAAFPFIIPACLDSNDPGLIQLIFKKTRKFIGVNVISAMNIKIVKKLTRLFITEVLRSMNLRCVSYFNANNVFLVSFFQVIIITEGKLKRQFLTQNTCMA